MTASTYKDRGKAQPHNHQVYIEYYQKLQLDDGDFKSFLDRGLTSEQIQAAGYKSKRTNKSKIASGALAHVSSMFDLDDVPGFFINNDGHRTQNGLFGIMIPSRDVEGSISSNIIRLEKPQEENGKIINKYMAWSSAGKTKGGKIRQNTHCPVVKGPAREACGVEARLTEGVVKADVTTALGSLYCLGTHGLYLHQDFETVLKELEISIIRLCFDCGEDEAPDMIRAKAEAIMRLRAFGIDVLVETWDLKYGKGIDDVIANGHEDKIKIASKEEMDQMLEDASRKDPLNGDWLYVIMDKSFYHILNFLNLDKGQFVDKFQLEKISAINKYIANGFPQVDDTIFFPGEKLTMEENGISYLNLWKDPCIKPIKGDVRPFLDHVEYLFPDADERQHLLDWMAYVITNPGEKILYALLIHSKVQGIGKSFLGEVMRSVLGHHNTTMLTTQMLSENYTGWAKRSCFSIVEEIMVNNKMEIMNKIKPIITQPTVNIREMQREAYEVTNRVNMMLNTNYENALKVNDEDRRYLILSSQAARKGKDYYINLFNWLETPEALSAILYMFQSWEHAEGFNPKGNAPETMAREEMIEVNRNKLEAYIANGINDEFWPFNSDLVSIRHLKSLRNLPKGLDAFSDFKWSEALTNAGAVKWLDRLRLSDKSYIQLWVIRHHEMLLGRNGSGGMAVKDVIKAYEKGSLEQEPGEDGNPLEAMEPI